MSPLRPFGPDEPSPVEVARLNRAFYDRVAAEFDATRREPWPFVAEFLATLTVRDTPLLDLGCGNGRHAGIAGLAGLPTVGVDLSRELLLRARNRVGDALATPTFVEGDAFRLPFGDATFPTALFLATIHHVPTRGLRVSMLRELLRVLRPGGRALVSSWKYPHPDRHPSNAFVRTVEKVLTSHASGELYEEGDELVPWGSGDDPPVRFVHFMSARELETTLQDAGFVVGSVGVVQLASKRGPDNVVAVAHKP